MITLELYSRDYRLRRQVVRPTGPTARPSGGRRGTVTGLSAAAALRLQFAARNLEGLTTQLHLTYPARFPVDGRLVKRHWARLREWLADRGLGGLWLLEFQARGAPHFLLFLNGPVDCQAVAERWFRIVGSGDPAHRRAGTRVERTRRSYAAAAYAVKSCGKSEQKEVPPEFTGVGRMWGTFGGVRVTPAAVVQGTTGELARVVRTLRKLEDSRRRDRHQRRHRDNGVSGWTGHDQAGAARRCLVRLRWEAVNHADPGKEVEEETGERPLPPLPPPAPPGAASRLAVTRPGPGWDPADGAVAGVAADPPPDPAGTGDSGKAAGEGWGKRPPPARPPTAPPPKLLRQVVPLPDLVPPASGSRQEVEGEEPVLECWGARAAPGLRGAVGGRHTCSQRDTPSRYGLRRQTETPRTTVSLRHAGFRSGASPRGSPGR